MERIRKRGTPELLESEGKQPAVPPSPKRPLDATEDNFEAPDGTNPQGGRKLISPVGSPLLELSDEQFFDELLEAMPLIPDDEYARLLKSIGVSPQAPSSSPPLASEPRVPTPEELQGFEAGILAFLKNNLQSSNFRKKDRTPLNDTDLNQLSKTMARAFLSAPTRLKANKLYPWQTHVTDTEAKQILSPVSLAIMKNDGTKAKIELFGKERGSGHAKKVKQRRKVAIDVAKGPDSLKLGKGKVLLKAALGKSDAMRSGQAKLRLALEEMKALGIPLGEDSGFRIAGNLKDRPPRNGRAEATDLEYKDNLWKLAPNLTLQQKMQVLSDVAKTIKKFHEAGYTHGDIKPENILLSEGENPHGYLIDFDSLAKEGANVSSRTEGYQDSFASDSDRARMQTRYTDIFALSKSMIDLDVERNFLDTIEPGKAPNRALRKVLMASQRVKMANGENAKLPFEQRFQLKIQLQRGKDDMRDTISALDAQRPEFKTFLDLLADFNWQGPK